jgi:hypothetical protein
MQPVLKADILSSISEPIVKTMWDLDISQLYRPPWLVMGQRYFFLLTLEYIYIRFEGKRRTV